MQDHNLLAADETNHGFSSVGQILLPTSDQDALAELDRIQRQTPPTDEDLQHLENILVLRAYVLGWTGDPLLQPATAVLAAYRQMLSEKSDSANRACGVTGETDD